MDTLLSSINKVIPNRPVLAEEQFAEAHMDKDTGKICDENNVPIHFTEEFKQQSIADQVDSSKDPFPVPSNASSPRQQRKNAGQTSRFRDFTNTVAIKAYNAFMVTLFWVGMIFLNDGFALTNNGGTGSSAREMPNTASLMASAAISHEEYMRRNPKWKKACKGFDKDKWIQADDDERQQQTTIQPGKDAPHMEELPGGLADIPLGQPCFPIKRICKIKSNDKYKVRWAVMGNLEELLSDCFAPTASKKVVWLLFALVVMTGLCTRFFDIKGAFMAEKPTRDVYVTIDNKYYILRYSVYGLKDAAKVFNDGLVQHLKAGGYIQSKWDQCLFYKRESFWSYTYLIFHVDDFFGSATTETLIDDFRKHMEKKYEVTENNDGVFLGIHMEQHVDETGSNHAFIFRKPYQLQNIFDKYIPNGPTISAPKDPMRTEYSKEFDIDNSPSCDVKEFRSVLGAVMQLTDCRPDIAFTIAKISQRQCSPRVKDMEALQFLIHYLWFTRDLGVILRRSDTASATTLVRLRGFTDCSFSCHGNGKSHYCIGFDLIDDATHNEQQPFNSVKNTGLFQLKSFMAPNVDLSSCQGEIGSTVELAKDTVFYRGVLTELGQKQLHPTPLYGDNDATRRLATHYDGSHKRVRYMLPKINWLMEQTKAEVIKLVRLATHELHVDIGTKNGRGPEFHRKQARTMGQL